MLFLSNPTNSKSRVTSFIFPSLPPVLLVYLSTDYLSLLTVSYQLSYPRSLWLHGRAYATFKTSFFLWVTMFLLSTHYFTGRLVAVLRTYIDLPRQPASCLRSLLDMFRAGISTCCTGVKSLFTNFEQNMVFYTISKYLLSKTARYIAISVSFPSPIALD